jgi:hypothetical protein
VVGCAGGGGGGRGSACAHLGSNGQSVESAHRDRPAPRYCCLLPPAENQEGLQVLKYVDGQKYEPQ